MTRWKPYFRIRQPSITALALLLTAFEMQAQQTDADRKSLAEIRAKAEKGDAQSQFDLGVAFYSGSLGAATNYVEAVKWYRKAAEQGHAAAQGRLGKCYVLGEGSAKDLAEAVKWSRKGADQGDSTGQNNLGNFYLYGVGVAKDPVKAVKWFRMAVEQNHAAAQYNLGNCYGQGKGVARDETEAVKWYRKAAEQNYAEGQYALGNCYFGGEGVIKDMAEAVKWFRKAAAQNHAKAQNNLGDCYAKGVGVVKDEVEAYKWFLLAAAQGDELPKKNMAASESRLTREQMAEGQKLARNSKPDRTLESSTPSTGNGVAEPRPTASGTGFFITDDGYLISNHHVVEGANQVRLRTGAGLISAKVVKVDAANDLALLKAVGRFAALPVTASRAVKLGSTVATVGFPNIGLQGFSPKLTKGEISSLSGIQDDARYFQISVPVQPGNSGGGLLDERGNVVGVVSAKLNARAALASSGQLPENVNYAVKSIYLLGFLESVPDVSANLKELETNERKFEDVVKSAEQAAVLVLVY